MRLKAIQQLGGDVVDGEFAYVYVEDKFGNPLMVACELADGMYDVSHVGDPDFQSVLRSLGVDKTVVVDTVRGPEPRPIDRQLLSPRG